MYPEEPNSKLQQLFERFNRRYWRGRLPHYTVIVSDKYVGARCEKRDRIIYINPSIPPRSVPQFLLHEMAHAAVKGYAHGKLWRDEMERLIRLGAPLKGELAEYSPEAVPQTLASILPEFFDAAFLSDQTWREVWRHKAYGYGFTDRTGRVENQYAAQFRRKARRQWMRGRRLRREDLELRERFFRKKQEM